MSALTTQPTRAARRYGGQSQVYDAEYQAFDQDIDFFRERLWRSGVSGELLELGCGTGRVCVPLAAAGYTITGIDVSEPMLRRAEVRAVILADKRPLLTLSHQDMTTFEFPQPFGAILAPFGALTLLVDADARARCLTRCRSHLLAGAPIWVDIAATRAGGPTEHQFDTTFRLPSDGRVVEKHTIQRRSVDGAAVEIEYHYRLLDTAGDVTLDSFEVAFRLALLEENDLIEELHAAGFVIQGLFGDWQGGPSGRGSPRCIVEALAC